MCFNEKSCMCNYVLVCSTYSHFLVHVLFISSVHCSHISILPVNARHVISSSKAEVANKGKGTTNSAIRTDKSEVVLGVDSRISYAGQRRGKQLLFFI